VIEKKRRFVTSVSRVRVRLVDLEVMPNNNVNRSDPRNAEWKVYPLPTPLEFLRMVPLPITFLNKSPHIPY
jgi:hypothetical protein